MQVHVMRRRKGLIEEFSFNSLFEMPHPVVSYINTNVSSFNSLFEMHDGVHAVVHVWPGPFNSLFEMPASARLRSTQAYSCRFQFSI